MIGHPNERRLLGFLDGRTAEGDRQRIARHLADCQRCRDVVQGHRAVREVFRLEPPSAPGGVLGRILDTRAGGGAVVLPVVDPGADRPGRTGYLALIASAAAIVVIAMVQLVPAAPFHAAWQWWSRTVAEFGTSATGSRHIFERPLMPVPVAEPAVLHPEKLRPMTVRYRTMSRPGESRPSRVDSSAGFTLALEPASGMWRVRDTWASDQWFADLDSRSGSLKRWSHTMNRQPRYSVTSVMTLDEKWLLTDVRYHGTPLPSLTEHLPQGLDSIAIPAGVTPPYTLGSVDQTAQLMMLDLRDGWSGSFTDLFADPSNVFDWVQSISYLVDGTATVTTPAGTFAAWRVRQFHPYGEDVRILWLRKSDGLTLREDCPSRRDFCSTRELLSVTYP